MDAEQLELGGFSISLAVKDLQASKDFYEKLGFSQYAGKMEFNFLIMKNGEHTIGLFQDMFEKNILTFNPGWDNYAKEIGEFTDVREIQRRLKAQGLELVEEVDETTSGPASITLLDPDGNPILIDQHV
ncbi:MAG TPA: VOC family protein [Anaerolineales bacterium]|nr:VOC family protein [Anaerolineales bacterium]